MSTSTTVRPKNARGPRYVAIDIDPQGLFVVSGTSGGGDAVVERAVAWIPGDEHGPPPFALETAKEIGEQLRGRLAAAGIPAAPVVVGIGRDRVILKELRYPPVPPADEPAVVRFQALKEITESPDEIVLDYTPVAGGAPDANGDRRATAVVVRKDVFAAVQAMCSAAGLKLAAVCPRPFAVAAGLGQLLVARSVSPDASAAVLTLGAQGGEFTVVRGGEVAFTRSVPAPVLANEVLLLAEVRRNLTVHDGQNPGHQVRAVYVAESEDAVGGWAPRLAAGLTVPVHAYNPLAGSAVVVDERLRGRFAGAAGLLAGKAAGAFPINFASPRQPRAESDPRKRQMLVAALAMLLLVAAGGAYGYFQYVKADDRLANLQAEKRGLEETLARMEPDRKRLEAADQWEGRGVNYLDELFDMTDRIPEGDQLRVIEFKGTPRPVDKKGKQDAQATFEIRGGARNGTAAAALMDAITRNNVGKSKYYINTLKTTAGAVITNVAHNQPFTITTWVNRRAPAEYTAQPSFSPPLRRAAVAPPGGAAER